MLEVLSRYQALPSDLRAALSTPAVSAAIKNLETKYQRSLAALVMRIALKEVKPDDFLSVFSEELNLSLPEARELALDLRHTVLFGVADYVFGVAPVVATPVAAPVAKGPAPEALKSVLFTAAEAAPAPSQTPSSTATQQDFVELDEVEQAIKSSGLQFASSEMFNRLKKILSTYSLGIRDRLVTKDALAKSVESGGLALANDEIERLLASLDGEELPITPSFIKPAAPIPTANPVKPSWLKGSAPAVRDVDYDFSALTTKAAKEPKLEAADELELLAEPAEIELLEAPEIVPVSTQTLTAVNKPNTGDIAWPSFSASATRPAANDFGSSLADSLDTLALEPLSEDIKPTPSPAAVVPPAPVAMPVSAPEPAPAAVEKIVFPPSIIKPEISDTVKTNWRKAQSGKVIMDDIKAAPRVYSPIDELHFMTIKNFRQLSPDPNRAISLIQDKIQSLAEDNFANLAQAISAWKQSPVNRMYVELCQTALDNKQPVLKALAQRLKQEPGFLTEAEFEAIIKLNRSLTTHK